MGAISFERHTAVEGPVVDVLDVLGPTLVAPDPPFELFLDLDQLLARREGVVRVDDCALLTIDFCGVANRWCGHIERELHEFLALDSARAPFAGVIAEIDARRRDSPLAVSGKWVTVAALRALSLAIRWSMKASM